MTDGLYLDDATHPVGDGGGCQGKAKEGVERYLGFDNCCNCGRTRSLGDKFHILALGARESMLSNEIAYSKTPHMPIFWREKMAKKGSPKIWNLGSRMAQKWSKMIQMPIICMKSSYLTNYYPHFIDFKMLRLIWTKMAETP